MKKTFAELELELLSKTHTDPNDRPIVEEFATEIIALVKKFSESGQSGGSAPYVAHAISDTIKKLCLHEPITPITGDDDEWNDVSFDYGDNKKHYQNKRCSAIFKDVDDGVERFDYLDALIKKDKDGICWNGNFWLSREDFLTDDSSLKCKKSYIKSFPFTPKSFYIDVDDDDVMINPKQLEEVREYYNIPYNKREQRKMKLNSLE